MVSRYMYLAVLILWSLSNRVGWAVGNSANQLESAGLSPKTYHGAWFDIEYPSDFRVKIIQFSSTKSDGSADAVEFVSPDNSVTFYIFSPQWGGNAPGIKLIPLVEKMSTKTIVKSKKGTVTLYTIESNNKFYIRSYQDFVSNDGDIHWVVGVKYKDINSYNMHKQQYLRFKSSLRQYAD